MNDEIDLEFVYQRALEIKQCVDKLYNSSVEEILESLELAIVEQLNELNADWNEDVR